MKPCAKNGCIYFLHICAVVDELIICKHKRHKQTQKLFKQFKISHILNNNNILNIIHISIISAPREIPQPTSSCVCLVMNLPIRNKSIAMCVGCRPVKIDSQVIGSSYICITQQQDKEGKTVDPLNNENLQGLLRRTFRLFRPKHTI